MAKKQIKIGVNRAGGPPPGFLWNIWVVELSQGEAGKFLNEAQYIHLALQLQELAQEKSPSHSATCSVDAIEDFFELRDWGGVLHPFDVRVYFGIDKKRQAIVVFGVLPKKNNGTTHLGDRVRMRRRWRKYLNGEYGFPESVAE